jgi:hypothetical protein
VFAGQRDEGFYVDLGSIFDLLALRPFQSAHLIPKPGNTKGVNATRLLNVHTIAIKVPITDLTRNGSKPTDPNDPAAVLGIYGAASRQKVLLRDDDTDRASGPFVRAIAGLTYPLVEPQYVPDGAASAIQDGTSPADVGMPSLKVFPYLGVPLEGYSVPAA